MLRCFFGCRIQCRSWFCHQTWSSLMALTSYGHLKLRGQNGQKKMSWRIVATFLRRRCDATFSGKKWNFYLEMFPTKCPYLPCEFRKCHAITHHFVPLLSIFLCGYGARECDHSYKMPLQKSWETFWRWISFKNNAEKRTFAKKLVIAEKLRSFSAMDLLLNISCRETFFGLALSSSLQKIPLCTKNDSGWTGRSRHH